MRRRKAMNIHISITTFLASVFRAFITSSTRIISAISKVTWFVLRRWWSPSVRRTTSFSTKSTKSMHPLLIRKKKISVKTRHSCQQLISAIKIWYQLSQKMWQNFFLNSSLPITRKKKQKNKKTKKQKNKKKKLE